MKDTDLKFTMPTGHKMLSLGGGFHDYGNFYIACFLGFGLSQAQAECSLINFTSFYDLKEYHLKHVN
jgi:hypothetical protein